MTFFNQPLSISIAPRAPVCIHRR